ncbi:uncharacterized protein [Diabrotica undecimpunctata]|uniref:uncharacterized protein n=1 Tax=Diabrotica undecimpunctata TaxID=50387 RepID=UPI003B63635F
MNMNMIPASDEDDDIESLRRAALHSLKKKNSFSGTQHGFYYPNFRGGRRGSKSGNFNGVRNTNLISLTPVQPISDTKNDSPTKEVNVEDGSSKFNRYNKSDRSGSESEEDPLVGISSVADVKKSESLDELMQELDSQIGGTPNIDTDKDLLEKTNKEGEQSLEQPEQSQPQVITVVNMNNSNPIIINPSQDIPGLEEHFSNPAPPGTMRKRPRSRSPFGKNRFRKRQHKFFPPMIPPQPIMPFIPPEHFQPQLLPFIPPIQEPIFIPQGFNMIPQPAPHPYFERPLSPLAINTESLTTATMAPLSPRSAAFVMQNKAIIEKRRRSPRRSYSRSPSRSLSRSPRRSLSPRRRSMTPPRRFRRSVSPRRFSRSPRRFSPSRKRSLSPAKRRSDSPKRKVTENLPSQNKPPIHNRLGLKSDKPEENKEIPSEKEMPAEVKEEELLDPVLAARKKKFETNEIKKKEGIIRLKPKEDKPKEEEQDLIEESKVEIKEDTLEIKLQKEDKLEDNISKEHKPEVAKRLKEDKPGVIKKPELKKTTPKTTSAQKKSTTTTSKTTNTVPTTKPTTTATTSKSAQTEAADAVSKSNKTEVKKTEEKPKDPIISSKNTVEDDPDEFKELERLLFDDNATIDEILDHKVEDIFSDEESASDNEGRFKAKEKKAEKKVPVLSFSKLVNGTKPEIKAEPLPDSSKSSNNRYQNRYADRRPRTQPTPKPPSKIEVQKEKKEKITAPPVEQKPARQKITLLTEKKAPRPIKQDRKIEIKIKNPSKYEKGSKPKSKAESSVPIQKIIVPIRDDSDDSSDDEEVIIESDESSIDDGDDDTYDDEETVREGDLRAQLSRKRAEKLKLPSAEVSSRILQYALQGAIFKKAKKKSKKKSLSSSDSKLPIHYRLGLTSPQDFLEDFQVKKKKKRKNRHLLEQV